MSADRVRYRNVFIHDGVTGELFGGFRQNESIKEWVFLHIVHQILLVADNYRLRCQK